MEAFFLPILQRISFLFILLFFAFCNQPARKVERSFYYWKTTFQLSEKESNTLNDLSVKHLYLRLFDVEWNETKNIPSPVSPIRFSASPPSAVTVTPVVFITNETVQKASPKQIEQLGLNIIQLMSAICADNKLRLSNEVQIDCDWSSSTKAKYFQLLNFIRQQPFLRGKQLSCTIRLHQLKFISLNGIPPVDKGLLMCYNMGNLRHPETGNSIIENSELKKYTTNLKSYPLPLDIALPIFDWYVWFRGTNYKGIIHQLPALANDGNRIKFTSDTTVAGIHFMEKDWLRNESSSANEVQQAAKHLSEKIKTENINIILYHLDEDNLNRYQHHELETIFDSFR